jgi:hypothetical protein
MALESAGSGENKSRNANNLIAPDYCPLVERVYWAHHQHSEFEQATDP